MKRSKYIGLTGSISTGKSVASAYLRFLDYPVVDADEIARKVIQMGTEGFSLIQQAFGKDVLTETGELDREKLGFIIFNDETKRTQLNAITHPLVIAEMIRESQLYKDKLIFFDVPLLIETEMYEDPRFPLDEIWLIAAKPEIQLQRLMKRDKISLAYAKQKISTQMSVAEKMPFADRIFDNSGDRVQLHQMLREACLQLERTLG